MIKKIILMVAVLVSLSACDYVEVGHVGIKVDKYGDDRGVAPTVVGPGKYYGGWNTTYYSFPTSIQTEKWTASSHEGRPVDESISWQIAGSVLVNADIGISYHVEPGDAVKVFQQYRQTLDVVADTALRNMVRDEMNRIGIKYSIDDLQTQGKVTFMDEVTKAVKTNALTMGITVNSLSFLSDIRPPDAIKQVLNAKLQATQDAIKTENEFRTTKAQQEKLIVVAQANVTIAQANAQAIEITGKAIAANPGVIKLKELDRDNNGIAKWNGVLPTTVANGATPFVNLGK